MLLGIAVHIVDRCRNSAGKTRLVRIVQISTLQERVEMGWQQAPELIGGQSKIVDPD